MDFLNGSIRSLYFKYLSAAFGSALITCVYSVVDMAMVGQYQGPEGTAALAVVAPVWNIIYSLGLLMGIGGSVIFSTRRGGANRDGSENVYFTAAIIGSVLLAALSWVGIIRFERPVLMFFGADEALYALAQQYLRPIKVVFPLFLFNQMLAAFLRNDKSPGLATLGVLSGGIFNIFGDYFFVFVCDMGIYGAGLATALSMLCPNLYIRIFMSPTPEILRIAPAIVRTYALSFLLLPLNIFSTYYFQAIMRPKAAFIVSVARGLVISGVLILVLPVLAGAGSIWFAMPITELAVAFYAVSAMRRYTLALPEGA